MCSDDHASSVKPSPAEDSKAGAAVSHLQRPPPVGKFWKENGCVVASRSTIPMAMVAVTSGKMLAVPPATAASALRSSSFALDSSEVSSLREW
jgi:hypothetical protein